MTYYYMGLLILEKNEIVVTTLVEVDINKAFKYNYIVNNIETSVLKQLFPIHIKQEI